MVAALARLPVLTRMRFGISGSTIGSDHIISENPTVALSSVFSLDDFIFKNRGETEGLAERGVVGMAGEAGFESGLAGRAGEEPDDFSV